MSTTPQPEKRCKHCEEVVVGDRAARAQHVRECVKRPHHGGSSPPPPQPTVSSSASSTVALKPLPVCPSCGKLFRNEAVLGEHVCPWGKSSSKSPEPGKRSKPSGPLGRNQLQGNCNGRRIEAFNAECNALKDYDNRMARLLAKQALSPPPPPNAPSPGLSTSQSTTRSVASTMSFTGGAERTRCRKCGKLVLTTTLRLHRDSCVVIKLGTKLERLKDLANNPPVPTPAADAASPSPSTSLNHSTGTAATQQRRSTTRPVAAALDLPEAYARLDEMDSLLAALSAVVDVPAGLRRSDGTLADRRVKAAMPELEAAFDAWKADVAAKVAAIPPPGAIASTLVAPSDASPTPGLRAVAHRPPADLSPTRTKRADEAAIQRCAELAGTKSAAAQEAAVFDAEVLALADAVRRGDLTLADATLPNHGMFRSTGYAVAVNPTLRNSSPEAA